MKTKFLVLLSLLSFLSISMASAQFFNKKKVIITEVVDKTGEVANGTKTYIRSYLTDAITNSEGYTGYGDIPISYYEYNFERVGRITQATLTAVYKRYEAEFVLISEINKLDDKMVLLTARIIQTQTGEIESSSMQYVEADLKYLPDACKKLVSKLLRKEAQSPTSNSASKQSFFAETRQKPAATATPTYRVGDYIKINGVSGVVFTVWNEGKNGKAVSVQEMYGDWKYADQKCKSLAAGWRLPTKGELGAIYNQKATLNNTLDVMAEVKISDYPYWSSDQFVPYHANEMWRVYMDSGFEENDLVNHKNMFRAVASF